MVDEDLHTVLECCGISHWFGSNLVLSDVNLKVVRGEIVALVGPSGCGKSTLLRSIVGTHPPCEGNVLVHDLEGDVREVRRPGRDRGIVYQQYSLFPFMTARENVAFGLMLDQTSMPFRMFSFWGTYRKMRNEHLDEATYLLEKLKLGKALDLYPHEMSGGMRQRAAIAQALVMKPEILLLDEPFGALDEATREELQIMLLTLYGENCEAKRKGMPPPYTIMIVTHELNEAIYVSDRVIGLSQYWDWEGSGYEACPGATIVYDSVAPVFLPEDIRNYESFEKQREEIRHAAFNPKVLQKREKFRTFWASVHNGDGKGVLS